ncbi:hypothetical protein R0137_06185 [Congregibacter brevis]|uniref:Uncharacterized protein n=1 Tax=Congregibacter brevis TaxID=3081201 RepID=A0ABZ0IFA9_9GAMM|nr:hypothetical protein R0137_06185 [Congregibacter sp. IMCC45268]
MKSYENILKSAKEAKTIASHITALGKVRAKTEDQVLLRKIDDAISSLQSGHAKATKGKSTPTCLDKATDPSIKALVEHCQKAVATKKPEWQVIAERNGWAPKT